MKAEEAIQKLKNVIRRKHLSLSTEGSYCGWVSRFCSYIKTMSQQTSSERKVEAFLTSLAEEDVGRLSSRDGMSVKSPLDV